MKIVDPKFLSIAFTDRDLCARSGTCIGICPTQALSLDDDLYPKLDPELCTECGLCSETCPGGKVMYKHLTEITFGHRRDDAGFDGHVRKTFVGYASDPRMRNGGAGGGVISGLLWDMLKHGDVDGVVATRMDPERPWLGEPFIARSYEELLCSQGSRYSVIPLNSIFQKLRKLPGRYAYAALPCHVHGYRVASQLIDDLKGKIHAVVGLFCGGGLEPFVVPELLKMKGLRTSDIRDFQFRGGAWPGKIRAVLKDGSFVNMHYSNYKDGGYNYFIGVYMPPRCQTCLDGSGEFSDVSVSDAWTRDEQGNYKFEAHSRILVRTVRGNEVLTNAVRRGTLTAHDVSSDPSYATHRMQTKRKGTNAPLRVQRLARAGKLVPLYDRTPQPASWRDLWDERVATFMLMLGRYWIVRYPLTKLLTSRFAIPLILFRQWRKRRKYRK